MSSTIELKESPHLRAETSITQYADALMLNSSKTKQTNIVLKKLLHVVLLAGIFMILEVIGGVIADSIAILSDAAHMLSDVLGFAISIISVWISSFPANERNSYGFHRAGVIGALASTVLIWILTGFLVYEAIVRILNIDDVQLNSKVMLVTAIFGLGTNLVMVKVLHGDEHGHSHHGHSHGSHDHGHKHSDSHSPPTIKSSSKAGQSNYYLYNDEENNQNENKSREKGHDSCCGGHEHAHSHAQHIYSPDPKAKQKQTNESVSTHLRSDSEDPELTGVSPPKEKEYAFKDDSEDHHSHSHHGHGHGHHDHDSHSHSHDHHDNHGHNNSHGHGHGHDACCHDDLNIRAAAIHIMGDILQSIGVIIGSIIILFSPETFKIIDPILTLVFSIIVLFTTKRVLKDCLSVIMQSTPDMYYLSDMTDLFERIPHVVRVHNIHMWSLTMGKPILSAHVVVDGEGSAVLAQITQVCRKYRIFHSTIQIENQNEETKNLIDCNHNIC